MQIEFSVASGNFGESKQEFEFGIDVFQKASGSDEGMCIQVESGKYVEEAEAKATPHCCHSLALTDGAGLSGLRHTLQR